MHSSAICWSDIKVNIRKLPTYMPINNKKGICAHTVHDLALLFSHKHLLKLFMMVLLHYNKVW